MSRFSGIREGNMAATAIVTGSSKGIGLAIAKRLALGGMNVAMNYRTDMDAAERALEEVMSAASEGVKVVLIKADVSVPEECVRLAEQAASELGQIGVLVNNAGITRDGLLVRMGAGSFDEVMKNNLYSAFHMTKAVASSMLRARKGSIINMSSVAGTKGNPGQANYSASKAGLIGLTLSTAKELGSRGIRVNAVAPGFIGTDMTAKLGEEHMKEALGAITLGRMGTPEEVAELVFFLAGDSSSYITGQVIGIDGGLRI